MVQAAPQRGSTPWVLCLEASLFLAHRVLRGGLGGISVAHSSVLQVKAYSFFQGHGLH